MKHLDLNQFMQDVHQNAVLHGWWEKEQSPGTIRSLFHCELSEAMEEHRADRPMLRHKCPYSPGACESQNVHVDTGLHCEVCETTDRKPEGIAVELMDFVIRIFDYLRKNDFALPQSIATAEKLVSWSIGDYQDGGNRYILDLQLPDLTDILHSEIALSDTMHSTTCLATAAGLAMAWVEARGLDPVEILLEKHEYNKTRPYKHGGKAC